MTSLSDGAPGIKCLGPEGSCLRRVSVPLGRGWRVEEGPAVQGRRGSVTQPSPVPSYPVPGRPWDAEEEKNPLTPLSRSQGSKGKKGGTSVDSRYKYTLLYSWRLSLEDKSLYSKDKKGKVPEFWSQVALHLLW